MFENLNYNYDYLGFLNDLQEFLFYQSNHYENSIK